MSTAVKERPILFSTPMVKALLAGTKTVTRRVVKPQPTSSDIDNAGDNETIIDMATGRSIRCPYGQEGDRLWVRETFTHITGNGIRVHYRADGEPVGHDGKVLPTEPGLRRWMPSIFMPRKLSRITLEITDVRVERLHDITEDDAKAEGVERDTEPCDHTRLSCEEIGCMGPTYRSSYAELWMAINGEDSWDANPWVWRIAFKRVTR